MLMKTKEIAAFVDMEAEDYHADKGVVGHSGLVKMLKSPKHFRHSVESHHEQTPSMAFGSAVHAAVLEPHVFSAKFVVAPKFDRRTKEGKADSEAWAQQNMGKITIPQPEMELISGIAQSISGHKEAATKLKCGVKEASFFWKDEDTGINCRIRPDFLITDQDGRILGILDLKTTQDASSRMFSRSMAVYGYDVQAAFYQDAVALAIGRVVPFYFLAVESSAPYGVGLYRTGERTLKIGRSKYRAALQMLQWCQEKDFWPSYQPFGEEEEIDIPHWERSLED